MSTKTESMHPHPLTSPVDKTQLWKECDVNKLVQHFHRYDEKKDNGHGQVERLGILHLNKEKRARLFPKKFDAGNREITITAFHISFGLDEKESPTDKFTFRPMISVVFSDGNKEHEDFDYGEPKDESQISNEVHNNVVPPPFKDWLSKNWMELDINLIDDMFVAYSKNPPPPPGEIRLVPPKRESARLRGYHFTSTVNNEFLKFINDHLGSSILQFCFHLGIDMNKFGHKEEFSFSPVFEVIIPEPPPHIVVSIHRYGLRSVQIKDKNAKILGESVYYEYIMPCPSSCPQE